MGRTIFLTAIFLLCSLLPASLQAQPALDRYIRDAFGNNLLLKEKKTSLEKGLTALREAKSLFLPSTWLETQYTLAKGGRSIDIPVGDLLNPVYQTLNQLTVSGKFPEISNRSEQFLPNNFYDARIKTTMPLLNPDIRINRLIREDQVTLAENDIILYQRELVKEIKTAYYAAAMTSEALEIFKNALVVVKQNLKVNRSLLENGRGLPAYVARSESEVQVVESQYQQAMNDYFNARAYFNFLLNRPLTDSVILEAQPDSLSMLALLLKQTPGIDQREELKSLSLARAIGDRQLQMSRASRQPRLNTFLDLAAQGFDFKVNSKSFFYLFGLQLQVPIYSGGRNLYKIDQARQERERIEINSENTRKQIELAAWVSRNNLATAFANYQSATRQKTASESYFKLIDRGYTEGVNSFIEFLDARNQETTSRLRVNISYYQLLTALADYERQTATYSFKS